MSWRDQIFAWWWAVLLPLFGPLKFAWCKVRPVLAIIWLGLPAGIAFAVICWLAVDQLMPAMDGTYLNFASIWRLAKSPLQQVKDVNPDDLRWAFSARLTSVMMGASFVCLVVGYYVRRWKFSEERLALLAQFKWCLGTFLACATIATWLTWHQTKIRMHMAPLPPLFGDF